MVADKSKNGNYLLGQCSSFLHNFKLLYPLTVKNSPLKQNYLLYSYRDKRIYFSFG
jgi:hypothetical protein